MTSARAWAATREAATGIGPDRPAREPLDLRLAIGAVAAWLAVVVALHAQHPVPLGLAGLSAGLSGATALAVSRRWPAFSVVSLICFCIALVLLPLGGRVAHARAAPLALLARRHAAVSATLTVRADPRALAAKGVAGAPRVAVETAASAVLAGGRMTETDGTVLILADAVGWQNVLPGQRVRVAGSLQPDLGGDVFSVTLLARGPPRLLGRPPWWQRAAGAIRAALRAAAAGLPDQERGLLPGLVDGDTSALDPVLAERFKMAGLTHLVAVSGTNCSIVVGSVLLALRRARVRPWLSALVGAAVLAMFVLVARPTPSVLRAAVMASIALVSLASGRPRAALPAVSAAVLALLIWNPTLAGSASFAMSVFATVALLVLAPPWAAALRRHRVPAGVAEAVAVAAAAHLVTAPIVAAIAGRVSLVAIPANVLAEPVVVPVTVLGFAAAVVAPVWLAGGAALAWLAGWPCRWLVLDADRFGGLHGATLPWPGGLTGGLLLIATLAVLGLGCLRIGARRVLAAAAATSLIVFIPVRAVTSDWPPPGWVFAACDVGQGDALLLPAGPNEAVEIDAGPDPVVIDRCLRDFGIRTIPLLVLTHFHLDHVAGLPGVVRGRTVGQVLAGPLAEPAAGFAIVRQVAQERHIAVVSPPVGATYDVGDVHLQVLGPAGPFHGTRSDPNNSSLVLRGVVRGVRILLPGDAEVEAQRALLDSGTDLRADILKVPHHGSAYSDVHFLAAVHASTAVVSVGLHNDYGHPAPTLLSAMARLGVPLFRTDLGGDIAVRGSPGNLVTLTRGVAASTVGAAHRDPRARAPPVLSPAGAKMGRCRRVPSPQTTCRHHCRHCSPSSATRNCSSTGPSPLSPLRRAVPTASWARPSSAAVSSTVPNCTRC